MCSPHGILPSLGNVGDLIDFGFHLLFNKATYRATARNFRKHLERFERWRARMGV